MLAQPFYRLTTLGFVLASIGFLALMRGGWVSKEMLLDARTVFRVVVAFAIVTFETGMPIGADHPVRGFRVLPRGSWLRVFCCRIRH